MANVIKGGIRFNLENVRPPEYATEHNDCTVRALKVVTGVPYGDAHTLCARIGRRPRKGLSHAQLQALVTLPHVYGFKVNLVAMPRCTLGYAMMYMRQGRYIVVKTGHAIACVDGVLHDSGVSGPTSRVKFILKFTLCSEIERLEKAKAEATC